ncbi:MAG: GNAT family N-acetyltransferase [Burkholderiales bacterium]|nr:GNAT family N-acetyltransferase [Burkholderiales bacterium]
MSFVVEPLTLEDVEPHHAQAWRENVDLTPWQVHLWGVREGGEVIAIAGLQRGKSFVRWTALYTLPAHRRRGLCNFLLDALTPTAEEWARQDNHRILIANATDASLPLFLARGYLKRKRSVNVTYVSRSVN